MDIELDEDELYPFFPLCKRFQILSSSFINNIL